MSEAAAWRLDLLRHTENRHGSIQDEHISEAFTSMESKFHCVSGPVFPPTVIDARQRSVTVSSRLRLKIYCVHKYRKDHCVGQIKDFCLLKSVRDGGKFSNYCS
jgi:hypothetical protein